MEKSKIAWTKEWASSSQGSPEKKERSLSRLRSRAPHCVRGKGEGYTWLSNQLKYFSSETASTAIGINPWYTPQISEHCP